MSSARPVPALPNPLHLNATQRLELVKALDAELCALGRGRKQALAQMTARLAVMKESRAYLSLGFGSVQAYAW